MTALYGTREHWDHVAAVRSLEGSRASQAMLATMCEAQLDWAGKRVLDIGTGAGDLPIALASRGAAEAIGIDVTRVGIERARARVLDELPQGGSERCVFREMDAERLDFASASFDAVTCLKMLWCLPRPAACLAEWGRVLSPGGALVLQIYARREECPLLLLGPRILSEFSDRLVVPADYRDPFELTPASVAPMLAAAGFESLQVVEHAIEVELGSSQEYWQTLGSIADSAYYTFTRLQGEHGAAIEAAWERRAARIRDADQRVCLGLTWHIVTARRVPP